MNVAVLKAYNQGRESKSWSNSRSWIKSSSGSGHRPFYNSVSGTKTVTSRSVSGSRSGKHEWTLFKSESKSGSTRYSWLDKDMNVALLRITQTMRVSKSRSNSNFISRSLSGSRNRSTSESVSGTPSLFPKTASGSKALLNGKLWTLYKSQSRSGKTYR